MLIESLLVDDEHDWQTANKHKPINAAWLRWRLQGCLKKIFLAERPPDTAKQSNQLALLLVR